MTVVTDRLAGIGITGARATALAATLDSTQVTRASDRVLRIMVAGRESGDATGAAARSAVVPGQELARAEVRNDTGIGSTGVSAGYLLDLAANGYGLGIRIPPCNRPYAVLGAIILQHSVAASYYYGRIAEVSNGVDTVVNAVDPVFQSTAATGFNTSRPRLRIPANWPRARTFRLQMGTGTAGNLTVFVPGTSVGVNASAEWEMAIWAVAL